MDSQPGHRTRDDPGGVPRWVKLTVIILLLAGLVFVIVMLVGGGHTPVFRHGALVPATTGE